MLRCVIFSCVSTWTWCYATWSSLAFYHSLDATRLDLLLQLAFHHEVDAALLDLLLLFNMNRMLRYLSAACSSWPWCYAAWHFAVQHEVDATLFDLLLRFTMNLMLRCVIFPRVLMWTWRYSADLLLCSSPWSWCYATWCSLPFHSLAPCYLIVLCSHSQRELDAMLLDLLSVAASGRLLQKWKIHPQSNPSRISNAIGRWIWAKHVTASPVF